MDKYIFWGGADVDPALYGMPKSKHCGGTYPEQDAAEILQAHTLIKQGIPLIGICRGAQLLNVVNGGILVQHIEDHANGRGHFVQTIDKQEFHANSTHHQMMIPTEEAQLLAWAAETTGVSSDGEDNWTKYHHVNEVVWYPKTKCLCIQPHPEWMNQESPFVQWLNKLVEDLLSIKSFNWNAAQ